jgi:hypothetical protein
MNINQISTEELKKELKKRSKTPEPQKFSEIKWGKLIHACETIIKQIKKEKYEHDDNPQYVYEEAMTAIFGENVFDWINDQTN